MDMFQHTSYGAYLESQGSNHVCYIYIIFIFVINNKKGQKIRFILEL